MQETAKLMIAQGGGEIIKTASLAGRQGYPNIAPYCAVSSPYSRLVNPLRWNGTKSP
jgi:meso-butanediol dehydrogenase / (S,S)-butanediol dehydrogenase / diacetyl reductase